MNDKEQLNDLALRYLGDELTDDERISFETRLADDQAAREAVARAVELSLAAREVFADDAALVTAREEARRNPGRRGWWQVAIAASVLIGLIAFGKSQEWFAQQKVVDQRDQQSETSELAVAWSEASAAWPTALAEEDAGEVTSLDEELELPTWMLAAVSANKTEMTEQPQGDEMPE